MLYFKPVITDGSDKILRIYWQGVLDVWMDGWTDFGIFLYRYIYDTNIVEPIAGKIN